MKVYWPECWICKHAHITHGLKEDIFVGCQQTYKKEECRYEQGEIVVTTSSITTTNKWLEGEASKWTAKELIEKLKAVPEDAQIYVCSEDCDWEYPATGFSINYNGDRTEVAIY